MPAAWRCSSGRTHIRDVQNVSCKYGLRMETLTSTACNDRPQRKR